MKACKPSKPMEVVLSGLAKLAADQGSLLREELATIARGLKPLVLEGGWRCGACLCNWAVCLLPACLHGCLAAARRECKAFGWHQRPLPGLDVHSAGAQMDLSSDLHFLKAALKQPMVELLRAAGNAGTQLQLPHDVLADGQRTPEGLFIKYIDVTVRASGGLFCAAPRGSAPTLSGPMHPRCPPPPAPHRHRCPARPWAPACWWTCPA